MPHSTLSPRTYYVKTGGSDTLDGRSDTTAWETLGKVTGYTFAPGDQVLFNKGDTWSGTLTMTSGGDDTGDVTVGAYGTGARPIIDAVAEYNTVVIDGAEYVTVDGLALTGAVGEYGSNVRIQEAAGYVTLSDLDVSDSVYAGIWGKSTGGTLGPITVSACTVTTCLIYGVALEGESAAARIPSATVTGCTISGITGASAQHGLMAKYADAPTLTDNVVHDCVGSEDWGGGIYLVSTPDAIVTGNESYTNSESGIHIDVNSNGFDCNRNLVHDCPNGLVIEEHDTANGASSMTYNTVHGCASGIRLGPGSTVFTVQGVTFGYNIIGFNTYAAANIDTSTGGEPSAYYANTWDYECDWGEGVAATFRVDTVSKTWAEWKALANWGANSINADPLFTDAPADDFTLDGESPATGWGYTA